MFLRKKGTSWSADLLRDELIHAGIRHNRIRLDAACRPGLPPADAGVGGVPPASVADSPAQLNG